MTQTMPLTQGDTALLDHPVAQRLLASRELARLAYQGQDGTPRALPMLFHWTGEELLLPTFGNSRKVRSLRANPELAVTIDSFGPPPEVLLLRGRVTVTDVRGLLPEYVAAYERYYGVAPAAANTAALRDDPDLVMTRVALRPTYVGVLDFQTRFPAPMTEMMSA